MKVTYSPGSPLPHTSRLFLHPHPASVGAGAVQEQEKESWLINQLAEQGSIVLDPDRSAELGPVRNGLLGRGDGASTVFFPGCSQTIICAIFSPWLKAVSHGLRQSHLGVV